jgi:outer membrane receptor protein involved in Fe transport
VVNLALRWQLKNLEMGLKLANVLDKRYAEQGFEDSFSGQVASFPLPEFNTRLHLRYDFK